MGSIAKMEEKLLDDDPTEVDKLEPAYTPLVSTQKQS